jgi:hypothetical protein
MWTAINQHTTLIPLSPPNVFSVQLLFAIESRVLFPIRQEVLLVIQPFQVNSRHQRLFSSRVMPVFLATPVAHPLR